jgi:hypothetical protein
MMKLHGTNVIKMSKKCKQTPMQFVVPDFNLVIITWPSIYRHKHPFLKSKESTAMSLCHCNQDWELILLECLMIGFKTMISTPIQIKSTYIIVRLGREDEGKH